MNALRRDWRKNYRLYIMMLPAITLVALFNYAPMYGILIAFKKYSAIDGILGSRWVGLVHFRRFIESYYFETVMKNTLGITLLSLCVGFPLPILFALLLNEIRSPRFKKFVQTITYMPHFISITVMVGMLFSFFNQYSGIFSVMIRSLGGQPAAVMQESRYFRLMYIGSGVWQGLGWNSILYIAVLSGVDTQLHEAATIDGANRVQRIIHINLPHLAPTIVIMLILTSGGLLNVGFEKVFLMQTSLNLDVSEVISTYVYKVGLLQVRYDFSAAVGLFSAAVNCALLTSVNALARRLSDTSLF